MKILLSLLILGFALISASAEDVEKRRAEETGKKYKEFETVSGRVYRDVTITEITDAGISITHADGLARLRFEHLKPEQRKDFGITKEGAAAVYTEEMKVQAAHEAKVAEQQKEQQKAKDELFAKQTAALLEAEKAVRPQKIISSKIESTLEIPTYPVIRGSNNAVLYGTRRHTPSSTNYFITMADMLTLLATATLPTIIKTTLLRGIAPLLNATASSISRLSEKGWLVSFLRKAGLSCHTLR